MLRPQQPRSESESQQWFCSDQAVHRQHFANAEGAAAGNGGFCTHRVVVGDGSGGDGGDGGDGEDAQQHLSHVSKHVAPELKTRFSAMSL